MAHKILTIEDDPTIQARLRTLLPGYRYAVAAQPEICLQGQVLTLDEQHIFTESMEQARIAGTNGGAVVVPNAVALPLQADRSRLAVSLENSDCPELREALNRFIRNAWAAGILSEPGTGQGIAISAAVRAWGIANSLSEFTAVSFCGLYRSIALMILSCTLLAFEQLAAIYRTGRMYGIIEKSVFPAVRGAGCLWPSSLYFSCYRPSSPAER